MTDNTEPTIDNILDVLEITVETVAWQEAKQDAKKSIEALISDQVAKAKGCTSCGKRMCDNCERLWQT